MLHLKRVELHGFKSFADRSELKFHGSGIAAIVGPNGCGKSNLSDAISWVLGEQSAKSLRGARMEDVIFAGTRDRKPLGLASVSLTMIDPVSLETPADSVVSQEYLNGHANGVAGANGVNGHAPHAEAAKPKHPSEITITRRLFRSGDSEYLINGKQVRLRDIQDLFMGTGLGPESYAIIEQGRIGQILSSKPQDRRGVIEEAAGITKFKTRKRLAEAKLESAKQNLTRVFDILEEVTRQVNSLKRQAAKAKRYSELKLELDEKLRISLLGRARLLEAEAAHYREHLEIASNQLKEINEQLAVAEASQQEARQACYDTEARLTESRKQLAGLNVEAERVRGRMDSQARQSASLEQRITQGEAEFQHLDGQIGQLQSETAAHQQAVADLEAQTAAARDRVMSRNRVREELQGQVREGERALESGRMQVLRLLGEASALKNQLAQVDEFLAGIDRDKARAEREEQAAAGDLERLGEASRSLSAQMAERQMELESIADQKKRAEESLRVHRDAAVQARRNVDVLRQEHSRLKARKDSLEEILSHRAYTTDSVKRLFSAIERGQTRDFKPLGVLADFVEVDPAYEKAAEEFLHEELEYVVVRNWSEASSGIDLMRSDLDGRATFLVHPDRSAPFNDPVIGPETGIAGRLSDHLKLVNGLRERSADLLPRLARCFLAEDREAAQRLAQQYPHLYFLLPDGVCYYGYAVSGGKKTGSGPLALKRELRELSVAARAKEKDLESEVARLAGLDEEIAALSAEQERLRNAQQVSEKQALSVNHEIRKLSEETARATSRVSVSRMELERLRHERQRSLERRDVSHSAITEKEESRHRHEEALEAKRQAVEELAGTLASIAEEHAALRVELAGLEERQRAERSAMARVEGQLRDRAARRNMLSAELERMGVERARLLADNIELDSRSTVLSADILALEGAVNELASREHEYRQTLVTSEEQLKVFRDEMLRTQEHRGQCELDLVRRESELKFLEEISGKELNSTLAELAAALGEDQDPGAEQVAEAERLYKEVKARIEALGPVNPQALEEYEETQQRYDFLNAQRQDLLDSIRDTERAIQEIDVVSREKFGEAFRAINDNFREAFQTLFGGGTGEMRLVDETNIGESGIDIVASPPGKKLQNVLLLSGGEKALTALALLMAIFRYQPSPFCILDEVDAPLDESNISRLMKLIGEMSSTTQFIVITHSKRTMEAAQTMYGVTMQDAGVSKLVSVRFNAPVRKETARRVELAMA